VAFSPEKALGGEPPRQTINREHIRKLLDGGRRMPRLVKIRSRRRACGVSFIVKRRPTSLGR
jgi:hypothetical protein